MFKQDSICALSSPNGSGAIGLIRVSGPDAISIVQSHFKGKELKDQKGQSLHFGRFMVNEELVDEILLSLFKNPNSYTGEDLVEISCHGSSYIIQEIIQALLKSGIRLAKPGEFTQRAFLNGKLDLSQAEAVSDLIASENKASHDLAMNQMKGGFSKEIEALREELIHFTALIELELDFSEEDVEFADRTALMELIQRVLKMVRQLMDSFSTGQAIKNGIPVAIMGKPNAGKSTLLNALLKEDKAIVSEIAGTTRDSIEDVVNIEGIAYRFIDTAGIRDTEDQIEKIGIQRAFQMMEKASLILYLADVNQDEAESQVEINQILERKSSSQTFILLANKVDEYQGNINQHILNQGPIPEISKCLFISSQDQDSVNLVQASISEIMQGKMTNHEGAVVSNLRHYESLEKSYNSLLRVEQGMNENITGDFLALDIRQALFYLGEITGRIDIDEDILGAIFSSFCIGK